MPYANNDGVRIHYHVEGDGPPLVLQHGLTSSLKNWSAYGFVDGLKDDYRLIMIDARGHGESDKPHNAEAYDMKTMANDVVTVLDDLDIDKAHYLGYSMGGRMGFNLANHFSDRVLSFILGGMEPYTLELWQSDQFVASLRQGIEAHVAHLEQMSGPIDADRKARLLANDPEALIGAMAGLRASPGTEDVLPSMDTPFLLYVGEDDTFYPGVKRCAELIPNVTFVLFPGLDHQATSQGSDVVLPHVTKFLAEVRQAVVAD